MKEIRYIWYIGAVLVIFILWSVTATLVELPIIPSPVRVIETLGSIFKDSIAIHGLYSLWRIVAGLFLAIIVGLPIGVAMGYFSRVDRVLAPLVI